MEISLKFVKFAISLLVYSRLSLLLFLGEVIKECVEGHLTVHGNQILHFCLCSCRSSYCGSINHKPGWAVRCRSWVGGSSQHSVLMLHIKGVWVHYNFGIWAGTAIIEKLGVVTSPNAAEVAQIFQNCLGAVHELLRHVELQFYCIIVVTHAIANVTGTVNC